MIDVHCHLTDTRFEIEKVIDKSRQEGVVMITSGTSAEDSRRAVELAEKYENVWATIGIHPEETRYELRDMIYDLKKLVKNSKIVGIGEIGLDYREGIAETEKKKQKELFKIQIDLAQEVGLPIVVHNRNADEDVFQILSAKYEVLRGKILMHCFTRNVEFMQRMSELGAYFSFGGMITYENNTRMRKVAMSVPEDKLLLETDSPYSVPKDSENKINIPVNVKIVARKMAEIKGMAVEKIENLTSANARRLFSRLK
jgi:TatD DNase family protein